MTEQEKRLRRLCFTGHRPEKIVESEEEVKVMLEKEIKEAAEEGFNVFISGMSRGVDIWAAETVLKMKEKNTDIKLVAACPFPEFDSRWVNADRIRLKNALDKADFVICISKAYSKDVYQKRNEWMVDHCTRVIAVYSGENSGTKNTVKYALKNNIKVKYIHVCPSNI